MVLRTLLERKESSKKSNADLKMEGTWISLVTSRLIAVRKKMQLFYTDKATLFINVLWH